MAAASSNKKRSDKGQKRLNSTFVAAMSHPIKVRCLTRMAERPTSPVAIGRELGMDPSQVSYHVRALEDLELVEQVEERPVRGAMEHLFRTVSLTELSGEEYAALPYELRKVWIETALSLYGADVMFSLETETLLAQEDFQISRTAMKVDEEGWEAIREVFVLAQEQVETIKAEAETRIAGADLPSIPILSFLSVFEMPPAKQ